MKKIKRLIVASALAFCVPTLLHAEPSNAPKMPNVTTEDMAAAQKETAALLNSAQVSTEVKKAQKQTKDAIIKFDPKYSGFDSPNLLLNMPKVSQDALNQRGTTDYDRLSKQFYAGAKDSKDVDDLVVFVSLSMPKESLRAIADQSARYGAVMVFRGLKDNSMKAMMLEMKTIIGSNRKVNMQINPVVFSKLNVQEVPTFAIIKGKDVSNENSPACAPASAFMSISGNVPLTYALEKLAASSPPDFARIAEAHIKQGKTQ